MLTNDKIKLSMILDKSLSSTNAIQVIKWLVRKYKQVQTPIKKLLWHIQSYKEHWTSQMTVVNFKT